jgi:hypothetical protein
MAVSLVYWKYINHVIKFVGGCRDDMSVVAMSDKIFKTVI